MRRISANYIFPVSSAPLKNGIIEVGENGEILNLIDTGGNLTEQAQVEFYNGIITPGFINAHCHLELSYLKNKVVNSKGLVQFLGEVITKRSYDEMEIIKAATFYDSIMYENGIVAVGDVSNFSTTYKLKKESKIDYYTFIEIFGIDELNAEINYNKSQLLLDEAKKIFDISASIAPHAPYSVSEVLLKKIILHIKETKGILSIHNQESEEENKLYQKKEGKIIDYLSSLGVDYSSFNVKGQTSLEAIIPLLSFINDPILFVHNIYTSEEELMNAQIHLKKVYWIVCPNSNLIIENKLPLLDLFEKHNLNVCIGTDSLASNKGLSILDEMKTIQNHFPFISFDTLIRWATLNGAIALKKDNVLGSIERGKSPGLNLISPFNFELLKLLPETVIRKLC